MSTKSWSFGRSIFFTGMVLAAGVLVDQIVGCMSAPAQVRSRDSAVANVAATAVPATTDELIRQMSLSAAVIFVGEVVSVRHPVGPGGSPGAAAEGVVEVDFRVDQAVFGVKRSSIYTLREWSGLWTGGTDRYRAGQHLLMLLRAPNAAGLTSAVHGFEGAIPLRGVGAAPGPYESTSTAAQWMVDVRWLQAQTSRQQIPVHSPTPVRGGGSFHSEASDSVAQTVAPHLVHAIPGPWIDKDDAPPPLQSLSYVLGLCTPSAESFDGQ